MPPTLIFDQDQQFFAQHPKRNAHIRPAIGDEQNGEFMSLGPHDRTRRRIIAWRVPMNCRIPGYGGKIMPIPFLLRSDETVEDEDEILLPFIDEIMRDAAKRLGIPAPKVMS